MAPKETNTSYILAGFLPVVKFSFACLEIHQDFGKYYKVSHKRIKGAKMDFFKLVAEVGFPIAAACAGGYFIFLTLKFILAGVMSSVQGLSGIITALDNRVKTMNHDVIRIDTVVSNALGLKPDVNRIARADGKNDARRD
jgi:hypothetical protein